MTETTGGSLPPGHEPWPPTDRPDRSDSGDDAGDEAFYSDSSSDQDFEVKPKEGAHSQRGVPGQGLTSDLEATPGNEVGEDTSSSSSELSSSDALYPRIYYPSTRPGIFGITLAEGISDPAYTNLDKQIPVLGNITFRSRPLNHHAIDLSCDAELAVCADDSVHILLPEFPVPDEELPKRVGAGRDGEAENVLEEEDEEEFVRRKQYHTYRQQFMAIKKPDPRVNHHLFEDAGKPMDLEYENADVPYHGVGKGIPTGFGSSLNQTVTVKWSPGGLGFNLRPVLAVLLTNGSILVYGEDADRVTDISARKRTFASWRILWGVGGIIPLPDKTKPKGIHLPKDKITAMAWSKSVDRGRALLSYTNDVGQIVMISVQYASFKKDSPAAWKVQEVARFHNSGPHPTLNFMDPDYVPHGSAYSLAWSPWVAKGNTKTAIVAHIARSYVGFRRVTITEEWIRGRDVTVSVEDKDYNGFCINTLIDAFIQFQDAVWIRGDRQCCMGVLGSPGKAHLFETYFDATDHEVPPPHSSNACGTTYPVDIRPGDQTNPITGLFIAPPNLDSPTPAPHFALVRLSATATNKNWYQTNVPDTEETQPQWAEHIETTTSMSVPVNMIGRDLDSDASGEDSDASSEDFDMPEEAGEQVHPWRIRIYGLSCSAGGGMSVALLSQHSTLGPERKIKTKLVFSWKQRRIGDDVQMTEGQEPMHAGGLRVDPGFSTALSTEAKMWEWMYGGGPAVPFTIAMPDVFTGWQALRDNFIHAIEQQQCVFCKLPVVDTGRYSVCDRRHSFATCASTGLAIMAPGISHACGICGLRTLSAAAMLQAAQEHGIDLEGKTAVEVCGGCGGKFIA